MAADFGLETDARRLEVNQQIAVEPLTYSAWYYSTDGSTPDKIVMGQFDISSPTTRMRLLQDSSVAGDPLQYNSRGPGADVAITSSITPSLNTWNHVAVTDSGTAQELWINGASGATGSTNTGSRTSVDNLTIGAAVGGGEEWAGRICEVAVWNRVLSDAEIAGLAAGFAPSFFPNGLQIYKNLVRELTSRPGWGPALTNTGSVAVIDHPPGIIYPAKSWVGVPAGGAPPAGNAMPMASTNYRRRRVAC